MLGIDFEIQKSSIYYNFGLKFNYREKKTGESSFKFKKKNF